MPNVTSQKNSVATAPVISEEADRALGKIIMWYLPATFAAVFAIPMILIFVSAKYPHSIWLNSHGIVFALSYLLWFAPFYIGVHKVCAKRLEFGRRYVDEQRWPEAAAALDSFDKFGQRFFDRTGEAHYLWAIALEKLGRKDQAAKARDFVLKNRPASPWAEKLAGSASINAPIPTASALRQRQKPPALTTDTNTSEATPAAVGGRKIVSTQQQQRGRRRRF